MTNGYASVSYLKCSLGSEVLALRTPVGVDLDSDCSLKKNYATSADISSVRLQKRIGDVHALLTTFVDRSI